MARKKRKSLRVHIGVFAIIVILIGMGIYGIIAFSETTFPPEQLCLPKFGQIECSINNDDVLAIEGTFNADNSWYWIDCGDLDPSRLPSSTSLIAVPYHKTCHVYTAYDPTFWQGVFGRSFYAYACKQRFSGNNPEGSSDCRDISPRFSAVSQQGRFFEFTILQVDKNGDNFIDSLDGDAESRLAIRVRSVLGTRPSINFKVMTDKWVLRRTSGLNYVDQELAGCDLAQMPDQLQTNFHVTSKTTEEGLPIKKLNDNAFTRSRETQVPFGAVINYVHSLDCSAKIDENVVQRGGKDVYVVKRGFYSPIMIAEDGTRYVDYREDVPDLTIECLPSEPTCTDDAKINKAYLGGIAGKSCSIGKGIPVGEFIHKSNTETCTYKCVNNKLAEDVCQQIAQCAGGDLYDPARNTCVKAGKTSSKGQPVERDSFLAWLPYILGGLLLLIIIVVLLRPKGGMQSGTPPIIITK